MTAGSHKTHCHGIGVEGLPFFFLSLLYYESFWKSSGKVWQYVEEPSE